MLLFEHKQYLQSCSTQSSMQMEILGLIYEMNVRPKIGRTVVSTQNLEFINMDVSVATIKSRVRSELV